MPELPEVETIIQMLRTGTTGCGSILNRTILSAELLWERSLAEPQPAVFFRRIQNQSITHLTRRGKYLVFHLAQDYLLIHLRMSGDLRLELDGGDRQKHDRLILHLDAGLRLAFNDARKFGRVWLVENPHMVLGNLGPEPFDETLSGEIFFDRLIKHTTRIKSLLLNQTFLAGLGNIYTDEALFQAKIHPCQPANELSSDQSCKLLDSIRQVLAEGIDNNGASIDWVYRGGNFQNRFRVYRRTGELCHVCNTPIQRCLVNQRSTHYCPSCQRLMKNEGE